MSLHRSVVYLTLLVYFEHYVDYQQGPELQMWMFRKFTFVLAPDTQTRGTKYTMTYVFDVLHGTITACAQILLCCKHPKPAECKVLIYCP